MLNSVEMSAQEAAWYLLRQPMSEASRKVEFIPTMWPHERTKTRKRTKQMDEEGITDDSIDIWTSNVIQKYEVREELDDVCLADFAAYYTKVQKTANTYHRRTTARILRWRAYPMTELQDYKREMVLLFLPFRSEMLDVLDCNKFLQLYDEHEGDLLQKRKEYDCEFNLEHTVEEYLRLHGANADQEQDAATEKNAECVRSITMEPNDDDIQNLPTHALAAVVKQRTNVMSKQASFTRSRCRLLMPRLVLFTYSTTYAAQENSSRMNWRSIFDRRMLAIHGLNGLVHNSIIDRFARTVGRVIDARIMSR